MMHLNYRALLLFALLSIGTTIHAETLQEAWQLALSGNFKIKAAEEEQRAADAQLAGAQAGRLPNLVLAADYLKLDNPPTFESTLTDSLPFSVSFFEEDTLYYSATTTLPLYTGGRISADIKAAEAQQSASGANASHTISRVKITVAEAYINVLRAKSAVGLARSHVKSLAGHQTDVTNLLNQGLVARNNLLTANVALANARQQLLQAKHGLQLARANYNRLLNRPLDTEFTLDPLIESNPGSPDSISPGSTSPKSMSPELSSPEQTLPLEDISHQALARRADIQTLKYRSEALDHNARMARSASKPQLGLSGTYFHHDSRLNIYEDIFAANVSMVWYVFDGGSSRYKSQQLQRRAAATKAQEDELAGLIKLQVRKAWLAGQAAQQRLKITAVATEQAEENLISSKNRFQAGLIVNTEVLDAENLRVQAHNNHSEAIFDATLATLRLKHATGLL